MSDPNYLPYEVSAVWLDRGPGMGSLSKEADWSQTQHEPYEYANDGRSKTRTTFYWKGDDDTPPYLRDRDRHQLHREPEDRRSWSTLAEWNDGVGAPTRKQDNFEADVRRWAQTFCNQLDLPPYQQQRTMYVVDTIDLSNFGWIPAEAVILGIISLVVDSETDADPDEWDPSDWIVYRDDFEQLMDDVEMDRGRLWTVRKRVHHDTDIFCDE